MENSNQPAFPVQTDVLNDAENDMQVIKGTPGLTKREYIAAMAMQGLLANARLWENMEHDDTQKHEWIAMQSKQYADELLKQLETSKP